jgi:O-antigen/teichoic acid export membrane protein
VAFPGTDDILAELDDESAVKWESSGRFLRGTATFAAATILMRAGPLLLLPFFTRILSADEYGQIGVITTLAAAVTTIVGLGLETPVFRGYVQAAQDAVAARTFVNTVGGFAVLAPIVLAIGIAASVGPVVSAAFGVPVDAVRLAMVGAAVNASATLVPLALLRAQERHRGYLQLTAIQLIATVGLTILFVAVLGLGVAGWMLAYLVSGALLLVRGLAILGHRWTSEINLKQLWSALAFGLPLVPHGFSHWGLAVSDRAVLGAFVSTSQIGAYYVAFQASLPISLVAIALSQATQPLYAEAISSSEQRSTIGRISTFQVLAIVLTTAAVALLGPPAVAVLLPASYLDAAGLIPWLAVGACLFGLYLLPMNAVAMMSGRTGRVWVITGIAAIANVALNLALVPHVGPLAAAIDTIIGYGVLLGGVYLYMRQVCHPPIPYEYTRIFIGATVVAVPCALVAVVSPADPALAIGLRLTVLIAVSGPLAFVGPFGNEARTAIRMLRQQRGGAR